jgi:hypothetical protein
MHAAMMGPAKPSWFDRLRRDRRLFVLLGFVLVAIHSLQPLAVSEASADGRFVVCTMLGVEALPGGTPVRHDGCDDCIVGGCGAPGLVKAFVASAAAWVPLASVAYDLSSFAEDTVAASPSLQGSPGIRAPPAAA